MMDLYDELDELYKEYDETNIRSEKIRVLKKIIELDPDDIDSMHRLTSFVPKSQKLSALLKLKEEGKEIVSRFAFSDDDIYSNHQTRPYMFVLYDLLIYYEENKQLEKAFELMQEMSLLNEGDNLGVRFHIVAYYLGQNKLDELKKYVDNNMDNYSVALTTGKLYIDELENNHRNDFKVLFDEFPYLYSFITKDIKLSKEEFDYINNSIEYYSPRGFFDQLIFYRLLLTFMTPEVKKSLTKLLRENKYFPQNNIYDVLPKITKTVLYNSISYYDLPFEHFIKKLNEDGCKESEFLKVKDKLQKFNIIKIDTVKDKKIVKFDEATMVMLKQYADKDLDKLFYLKDFYESYIDYLRRKSY